MFQRRVGAVGERVGENEFRSYSFGSTFIVRTKSSSAMMVGCPDTCKPYAEHYDAVVHRMCTRLTAGTTALRMRRLSHDVNATNATTGAPSWTTAAAWTYAAGWTTAAAPGTTTPSPPDLPFLEWASTFSPWEPTTADPSGMPHCPVSTTTPLPATTGYPGYESSSWYTTAASGYSTPDPGGYYTTGYPGYTTTYPGYTTTHHPDHYNTTYAGYNTTSPPDYNTTPPGYNTTFPPPRQLHGGRLHGKNEIAYTESIEEKALSEDEASLEDPLDEASFETSPPQRELYHDVNGGISEPNRPIYWTNGMILGESTKKIRRRVEVRELSHEEGTWDPEGSAMPARLNPVIPANQTTRCFRAWGTAYGGMAAYDPTCRRTRNYLITASMRHHVYRGQMVLLVFGEGKCGSVMVYGSTMTYCEYTTCSATTCVECPPSIISCNVRRVLWSSSSTNHFFSCESNIST